jgi:hypothetical protein
MGVYYKGWVGSVQPNRARRYNVARPSWLRPVHGRDAHAT